MSLYTFSTAVTELGLRLGNRSDLGTRLNTWLDAAQLRIASTTLECETLEVMGTSFTTVAGQSAYVEGTDITGIVNPIGYRCFRNNTVGIMLRRFPWSEYRQVSQQAQSAPLRWTRWGTSVALDPQPDPDAPTGGGPYTILIDWRREPASGVSELPNHLQEAWITVAEWIGWKALQQNDRAQGALALLPQQIQRQVQIPLDRAEWESFFDTQQTISPLGFTESGWI